MSLPMNAAEMRLQIHADDVVALDKWINEHCENNKGRTTAAVAVWIGRELAALVKQGEVSEEEGRLLLDELLDLAKLAYGSCLRQEPML